MKIHIFHVCILVGCVFVCSGTSVFCPDAVGAGEHFREANELYTQGEYEKARILYETMLTTTRGDNATLYYNIGNCYFKENNLGKALVAYKRAFSFNPHDSVIKENIEYLRSLVQYKIEDTRNWYIRTLDKGLSFIRQTEALILFLGILLLVQISFCFQLILRKGRSIFRVLSLCLCILLCMSGLLLGLKSYFETIHHEAIVLIPEAKVRYGPTDTDKVVVRLATGIELFVKDYRNGWRKIELIDGTKGWMRAEAIEEVFPRK